MLMKWIFCFEILNARPSASKCQITIHGGINDFFLLLRFVHSENQGIFQADMWPIGLTIFMWSMNADTKSMIRDGGGDGRRPAVSWIKSSIGGKAGSQTQAAHGTARAPVETVSIFF